MSHKIERGWLQTSDGERHISKESSSPRIQGIVQYKENLSKDQKHKFLSSFSVPQEEAEILFEESQPPKPYIPRFHIRFHGKSTTGKTTICKALCRLELDPYEFHSDSHGLCIRDVCLPIKYEGYDEPKWVKLRLEDVGAAVQERYSYLKRLDQNYDAHVVVFSMTDRDSLAKAKEIVEDLRKRGVDKLLVVGTKLDKFLSYQLTDQELEDFAKSLKVIICLVNAHAPLTDEYGVYNIVEELAQMGLWGMEDKRTSKKH